MSKSYKILVVDDEVSIREAIRLILELDGFIVKELDNGNDVEEAIIEWQPDMILMDVMMGDCDGRDICKKIKSNPETSRIPVLIISATHGIYNADEKNCGADAYLAKPFAIDELISLIYEHLLTTE